VICSDKTGTLTRSEMTIERVITASAQSQSRLGLRPQGASSTRARAAHRCPARRARRCVLSGGSLAGNAALRSDGQRHGDPRRPHEAAFLVAERKLGAERAAASRSSVSRSPVHVRAQDDVHHRARPEQGASAVLDHQGRPDVLLERCTARAVGMQVRAAGRGAARGACGPTVDAARRSRCARFRSPTARWPGRGSARGRGRWSGSWSSSAPWASIDSAAPEVGTCHPEARRAGIRVIMITGDHPRTAARIAADLGIVEPAVPR
jgi:hypothetical protein